MIVVGFKPSQNAARRLYRSKPWLRASVSKPKPFLDHLGHSTLGLSLGTTIKPVSEREVERQRRATAPPRAGDQAVTSSGSGLRLKERR
jgi:hypothetical protein